MSLDNFDLVISLVKFDKKMSQWVGGPGGGGLKSVEKVSRII